MNKSVLSIGYFCMIALTATTAHAETTTARDFIDLNPYSTTYLACEEIADKSAPIGYEIEHEKWKEIFMDCVKSIEDTIPAAGGTMTNDVMDTEPDTQYEIIDSNANDAELKDRSGLIPTKVKKEADYQLYQDQLLEGDRSGY